MMAWLWGVAYDFVAVLRGRPRTCPQASVAERERRMIYHGVAQKSITQVEYSVEYGMNGYSANLLLWTDGDDVMGTDIV